ncbi:hypothetical protein C2845_PM06G21720 [Panicum miliaceum]|uniref:Uncharacterized protein n=1 Tax=Panicum miliaceum TaxID=4540 RepID=A0A3L6RDK1_PANMI|nr:hypothetical protein C2845_PM06G21720 [Panicum miliaceum]
MAAVHGAPCGGAQVDRPRAPHLVRRDPPGHIGVPQPQLRTMDRRVAARLEVPPASMLIFSNLAMLGTLALYDRVLVPRLRRLTGRPAGITHLQRTGIGLAISTLSNAVSAVVEAERKRAAARHGLLDSPGATVPMSVIWMAPQYAIHGVAGVHGRRTHGVPVRPGAREHEELRCGALADHVGWELHGHAARDNARGPKGKDNGFRTTPTEGSWISTTGCW